MGDTYTYTPTTVSESWSTGSNWSGGTAPSSASTTELTFVGNNSTVLANSLANTNTDNISGVFQLNILNLQGTGPASGAGAIAIASTSPATGINLVSNSGTLPVVNLNANNGAAALTYTISAPVSLSNNTTFTGNGTATFLLSGALSGAGTLTKSGTSTLTIGGNTANGAYTKDIFITAGALAIANPSAQALGTGTIHLQGTGILSTNTDNVARTISNNISIESANTQFYLQGTANSLTLSGAVSLGNNALNPNNFSNALILTGSLSTSSSLVKNGLSSSFLRFSGAQSFTGGLVVNQRALTVDYVNMAGSNMINSANTLSFGASAGTVFQVLGKSGGASSQSLGGVNLGNPGLFAVISNGVGGGKAVLNLGSVTANRATGAAVDFALPSVVATQDATNGITTTSANTGTSILGGWATVGQTDWAVSAGNGTIAGNITALASYTASTAGTTAPGTSANVDFQASNTTAWTDQTVNSLRFNTGPATLTIGNNQTLNVATGGVLNTLTVGANANTITGGAITGPASGELIITNYATNPSGTSGAFTVASNIVDNGGPTALTINSVFSLQPGASSSRASITTISGNNTYTGATYISGVASTLNLNSGTGYAINGNGTVTIAGGASAFSIIQQKANQFNPNSVVTFAGPGVVNMSLNGFNLTLAGLNGGAPNTIDNSTSTAATLTLNTAAGVTTSFAGRMRRSTTTLVIAGLGTQIITNGTNDIGAISVTGGTLAGNSTMTSTVTVGSNGKLRAGTGTNTSETLTIANNLSIAPGGVLEFALGADGADTKLARTSGIWSFDTSQKVSILDLGITPNTDYTLITGLATASINVSGWTLLQPNYAGYSFSSTSNSVFLHLAAVPEPSSILFPVVSAIPLTRRQRRQ